MWIVELSVLTLVFFFKVGQYSHTSVYSMQDGPQFFSGALATYIKGQVIDWRASEF